MSRHNLEVGIMPEHVQVNVLDARIPRRSRETSAYINKWDDLLGTIGSRLECRKQLMHGLRHRDDSVVLVL